ncbi:MAG: arsenate reductase ArsC [Candidatus Aegiribacteria sp.]|nr:arsenate reductase ArsC [Candidatus Aegiribacteria sp.]
MENKLRILFLCTGNACRSQMAEGFARNMKGDVLEVFSAGIVAHGLNSLAIQVMREAGVDITEQWSKTIEELNDREFDYVITVCDNASENCPYFPAGIRVIHKGFDDPPVLARNAGSFEGELDCYRRVRDEIKAFIKELPDFLKGNAE